MSVDGAGGAWATSTDTIDIETEYPKDSALNTVIEGLLELLKIMLWNPKFETHS